MPFFITLTFIFSLSPCFALEPYTSNTQEEKIFLSQKISEIIAGHLPRLQSEPGSNYHLDPDALVDVSWSLWDGHWTQIPLIKTFGKIPYHYLLSCPLDISVNRLDQLNSRGEDLYLYKIKLWGRGFLRINKCMIEDHKNKKLDMKNQKPFLDDLDKSPIYHFQTALF